MALNAGNAACSSGLSKRIYDAIIGGTNTGFSGSPTVAQLDSVRALAYGIAVGVVAEIQANAVVTTTINAASGGGLQQVDLGAGPVDTLAAAGTHLIYGAVQ